ncbi:MAG: M23 family metallopeptidase [Candidatus Eisenbacteria bacterium]
MGGVFALSARTLEHWGWSGSWRYPVGAARDFAASGPGTESAYRVLRTVGGADEGTRLHQGADLGCGRGGGPVRAAAAGLVLVAERTGWNSGYGRYVVLGHRLPRGRLAYTVYGHLAEGSIPVRAGQTVAAGVRLGRIGQSGRATTPHLHFEVRMAGATDRRWEREVVVDPLEFVAARLATPCGLDTIGRYLEWAQYAGLFDGEIVPGATLSRGQWWRMLAVSSRQNLATLPLDAGALAESLIAVGVLPQEPRESPGRALEWNDFARDLARIRKLGLRLPARPMTDAGHRATCETWLGTSDPSRAGERDARRRLKHPTVAAAVLAVADLAPAQERPNSRRTRKRSGPRAVPDPAKPAAGGGRP